MLIGHRTVPVSSGGACVAVLVARGISIVCLCYSSCESHLFAHSSLADCTTPALHPGCAVCVPDKKKFLSANWMALKFSQLHASGGNAEYRALRTSDKNHHGLFRLQNNNAVLG